MEKDIAIEFALVAGLFIFCWLAMYFANPLHELITASI